ncbi:MAG: hypothetical protein IPL61_40045 [Myxococcales bacterium]|nr:hypothetical protein [Myxococcales bacterium]
MIAKVIVHDVDHHSAIRRAGRCLVIEWPRTNLPFLRDAREQAVTARRGARASCDRNSCARQP